MTHRVSLIKTTVVLLAAGSVAAAAAPLVWKLRGHDTIVPPIAEFRPQTAAESVTIDLDPVLNLTPFGAVPIAEQENTPAAQQQLNLTLLGVIVRDDPLRSMALIGTPTGEANFRIGDIVTEQVTLTEVAADHVVLNVGDESRKLGFDGADLLENTDIIPTGEDRLAAIMAIGQGTTISERNDAAQSSAPVTTQDYIDLWRDRIRANPAEVLDAIGLVPVENGYMISEKHDSGVNRAGLKAGDIVRTLNGQPVGDVESDRVLYDRVADSGMARIEVERNGRTIVMSFPLQ